MSNSYRNCCDPGGTSGTLERGPEVLSDSISSGVPPENSAGHRAGTREHRPAAALFVSTDLQSWITGEPHAFARDVQINDTAYRRLDPKYYAWLRSRMNLARSAHSAARIDDESFEDLRSKFNRVHEWAVAHLGQRALANAVRDLDARDYRPPTPEPDSPATGQPRRPACDDAMIAAMAMVDEIAETALALGWKRERLYGTGSGRLFSHDRGLVCFVKPGDRLGEVTLQSIEIVGPPPAEVRQRFYNPDVDQPWIRRIRHGR